MSTPRWIGLLLAAAFAASPALGHGGNPPPPPPREPPTPPSTPPETPPPPPIDIPQDPPPTTPEEEPRAPETPRDDDPRRPPTTPEGPDLEPEDPEDTEPRPPETEKERPRKPTTRDPVRKSRGSSEDRSWRVWWEFNREHVLSLRRVLRTEGVVTGRSGEGPAPLVDALGEHRERVHNALRVVATRDRDPNLRAAALVALGRIGDDQDARLILKVLRERKQPSVVLEAAAVGIGLLVRIEDGKTSEAVRDHLKWVMDHRKTLPTRARGLALVAAGMRARQDPSLIPALLFKARSVKDRDEAANLTLALGLSQSPMVLPELVEATRSRKVGKQKLDDSGLSHAAAALGWTGDPIVVDSLLKILKSRRFGVHAKRGAVLALGRLLREVNLTGSQRQRTQKALVLMMDKSSDPMIRGFCAVSLGAGRPPAALEEMKRVLVQGGDVVLKPYCALGLGFAARTLAELGDPQAGRLRKILRKELETRREPELGSALCIATGLSGDREAEPLLRERLNSERRPEVVRGAAAQALGLLGTKNPAVAAELVAALRESSGALLEDAALALGLLGNRSAARDMVALLKKASTIQTRGRLILGLAHMSNAAAAKPLLELLMNSKEEPAVREFAALALGLMGDRRPVDALFALDAFFNYYGTNLATNELIRLY